MTLYGPTDKDIIRQILEIIKQATWGIRDLEVIPEQNCLVLRGHCARHYQKKEAQDAAMRVLGIAEVANRIQVGPSRIREGFSD